MMFPSGFSRQLKAPKPLQDYDMSGTFGELQKSEYPTT
jgi:hypothetical protein